MIQRYDTPKTVIAVVGPTAVGKTSVAIQLASHFQTEVLSADSRQCFRELSIGVARPSTEELQTRPHHFIASHSIQDGVTAADYEVYALQRAIEIFETNDQLILVGGTGLYVRAFLEGLDPIPDVDASVRQQVIALYEQGGIEELARVIREEDPDFAESGEMKNPQRMMRALEVMRASGTSILSHRTGHSKGRPFAIQYIGLELPRTSLVERIDRRVESMIEAGWLEEARAVYPYRSLNALQTVGYQELFDHIEGKYSLEEAIERIKIATRQYAKRQMTWFKKNSAVSWFSPENVDGMLDLLQRSGHPS